jgi:hypothetical protein
LQQIRGRSIELSPGEFFLVAIVLCHAGACKRAILLCGKAVNPVRFVRRNTLKASGAQARNAHCFRNTTV